MSSWKVIRKLGEGGMGEVFLVETPEGEKVAVKTLSPSQRGQIALFEAEAKLLTKLRHPAIASVLGYSVSSHDIFGEDKGPCFWMEYVEGEDLLSASQKAMATGPEAVLDWLKQALEALQYLHSQSILHGDLSPRNVLVDRKGRLKLLDFGLASSFLGSAKFNAGTLPYLAPERIYGKNLPASDLFSIGTLFYEALSDIHPRAQCRSLQEMIRAEVKPLAERLPVLAQDFSLPARVIDRMIQADLKNRFAQAKEALAALSGGSAPKTNEGDPDFYSARMFGAEKFLEKAGEALNNLPSRSSLFFLHGITGVRKKRFVKELQFQAALEGIGLEEVGRRQLRNAIHALKSEPSTGAKGFLFLNLDALPIHELFPILSLLRDLPKKGRFLLFSWSDDGLDEEKKRFFDSLIRAHEAGEVHLKNLNREESFALMNESLGEELNEEVKQTLFEQTQGNPALLLECIRLFRELKITTKKHFSKDWMEQVVNLHSFEDLLSQRLERLNKEEKEILLLIAAAGEPVSYESLSRLYALSPSPVLTDTFSLLIPHLDDLLSRDLITLDPETKRYRLSIPSLEGALFQKTPLDEMQRVHGLWMESLKGEKSSRPQKFRHALFLKDKALVTEGALPVAEFYRSQGDRTASLRLIQESLELIDDPIATSRLLRLKVNVLNELGRFQEALIVCEDIFHLAAGDEPLALKTIKYWFFTGLLYHNLGKLEEVVPRLRRCLEEAEKNPDPFHTPFETRAHTLLGIQAMDEGRLKEADAHFEKALKQIGKMPILKAEILRYRALLRSEEKQWKESQDLLQEARQLYKESQYLQGELVTLLQEGNLGLANQDPQTAEKAFSELEKIAEENEEEMFLAGAWSSLALLARRSGRLTEALELFGKALEIFRTLGKWNNLGECLAQGAMAEAAVGHFQRSQERIGELERLAEKFPRSEELAKEASRCLHELKEGVLEPLDQPRPPDPLKNFWDQESALRFLIREGKDPNAIESILKSFYEKLPLSLKVSFEERADYKKWVLKKE